MIRICPEPDGRCPHGMDCQFAIDRGSCDMAGSRASLSVDREREHAKPRECVARALLLKRIHDAHEETGYMSSATFERLNPRVRGAFLAEADAVLKALISHGWITIDGLEAMKKERGME